jgi:hypothetical protein
MLRVVPFPIGSIRRALAVGIVVWMSSGCSTTETIRVRVVDGETGMPIEGAVTVYELHAATGHGTNYTQKAIYEAVSDGDGWIEIPPQRVSVIISSGLSNPTLKIFRTGYNPEFLSNVGRILPTWQEVLKWTENGQTIKLKRPQGFQEYVQKIDFLNRELESLYYWPNDDPCGLKAIPRAVMSVEWEAMQFEVSGRRRFNSTVLRSLLGNEAYSRGSNEIVRRCGSPTEFFNAYSLPCPNSSGMLQNIRRRSQIEEVGQPGIRIVLFTLGYCPSDGQNWIFQQGVGWQRTQHDSLDFIQDKRHAK